MSTASGSVSLTNHHLGPGEIDPQYLSLDMVAHLFSRYNKFYLDKNKSEWKTFLTSRSVPGTKSDESTKAFLVMQEYDDVDNATINLVLQSKAICDALTVVMGRVIPINSEVNPHNLYHYLPDLENFDFARQIQPVPENLTDSKLHLKALTHFLRTEYILDEDYAQFALGLDYPMITFDILWMIFKPRTCLFFPSIIRLYQLYRIDEHKDYIELTLRHTSFHGKGLGFVESRFKINHFSGYCSLTALECFPVRYAPAGMEAQLKVRGKKYLDRCLKGQHHVYDAGKGKDSVYGGRKLILSQEVSPCADLDPIEQHRLRLFHYQLSTDVHHVFDPQMDYHVTIPVDKTMDYSWNEEMLVNLVLDPMTKTLVKGLIDIHNPKDPRSTQDLIPGKGAGLIMLFSGPPGIGKTATAEAVAEASHRGLYRFSATDLGSDPEEIEDNLSSILEKGAQWGLVLLLDEADVYLEQRTTFDIKRNSLVSVFLRQLEYYKGILILTTNRVEAFDKAFESSLNALLHSLMSNLRYHILGRIHFNLRFPETDKRSRIQLWKLFLNNKLDYTQWEIEQLSDIKLSGRMIKNAVSLSVALAKIKKESLSFSHIMSGLRFIDPSMTTPGANSPLTGNDEYNIASPPDPALSTPRYLDPPRSSVSTPNEQAHRIHETKRPRIS